MSCPGKELYYAAFNVDEAAVRALLGQGVRPDEWRNEDGWTALHMAACNGHTGIARLLIRARADINAKADFGWVPLHYAARWAHADTARFLLNAVADVAARAKNGSTPLHFAAQRSDDRGAAAVGADLDARRDDGKTPRDRASTFGKAAAFDAAVARARGLFWTRALHPWLPPGSREVVVTVVLCLWRVATTAAAPGTALRRSLRRPQAMVLPVLPLDLWEMILGFVRAVDLLPKRR